MPAIGSSDPDLPAFLPGGAKKEARKTISPGEFVRNLDSGYSRLLIK